MEERTDGQTEEQTGTEGLTDGRMEGGTAAQTETRTKALRTETRTTGRAKGQIADTCRDKREWVFRAMRNGKIGAARNRLWNVHAKEAAICETAK